MEQLSHEKLDVYQCSIEFLGVAESMIQRLPQGYSKLADQSRRGIRLRTNSYLYVMRARARAP